MLFIVMHFFRGEKEGGIGLRAGSNFYGISVGTLSNHIRHFAWSLRTVLSSDLHAEIRWKFALETREMESISAGFPTAVCFDDGTNISAWKPHDGGDQIKKYDGHHHMQFLASLVCTDIYGVIIRVDCTVPGRMQDRAIFDDSGPYRDPALFFSPGQIVIGEKGFTRKGTHVIFPFTFWKEN